jgi:hypothetical protein
MTQPDRSPHGDPALTHQLVRPSGRQPTPQDKRRHRRSDGQQSVPLHTRVRCRAARFLARL